ATPPGLVARQPRSSAAASARMLTPQPSTLRGPRPLTSLRFTCDTMMKPNAFTPNYMPKRSAGMPNDWMNTNGADARYEKNAPNENMKTSAGPTKRRLRASGSMPASAPPTEPLRACVGCDSSRKKNAEAMQKIAYTASSQKIQCHDA